MDKQIIKSQFNQLSLSDQEDILGTLVSSYSKNIENDTSGNLPQDKTESIGDALQENKETSSTPQYNGVYFDPSLPENDDSGKQTLFNITYINKLTNKEETATFARHEGIQEAFDKQGIRVIDCKDTLEATKKIKEMLAPHEKDFPELWELENWFDGNNKADFFKLLGNKDKGILNNTPYAGFQDSNGDHYRAGSNSGQRLPLRVAGKFASLWSNLDGEKAYFAFAIGSSANLVWAFSK